MKRILFVDDDQSVLDGLQNLLHRQRREWAMTFTLSAEAALDILAAEPFDVVVTDMRMPIVDGAALLATVKQRHPGVARIVLSGHAHRDAVMRALPVAHQYLSKPCDAEQLRTVIDRVCNLQVLLGDEHVRRMVGQLDRLPSLPRCYTDLTTALNDPNVSLARLVAIVETDPAMCAKVLQLVNSAYFGLAQRTSSIVDAVRYLGVELLKGLALIAGVFAPSERLSKASFSYDQLQQHSLLTAQLARRIIPDRDRGEEAFTAGVVHEIGQIVLARARPGAPPQASPQLIPSRCARCDADRAAFGVTHAQVGAYLLGVWGLPFPITETVAFCCTPATVEGGSRALLAAVHVADALVTAAARPPGQAPIPDDGIDLAFLSAAGYLDLLPGWRAIAAGELNICASVA